MHCTHKTFILHIKTYCIAHAKHSYCKPVYKTWSSFEVCHLCVRFHIVRSFNISEAHSARHVSAANQFCCRCQQNMTFQTLYLLMHTWGPCWYTDADCRVDSIKYDCHNVAPICDAWALSLIQPHLYQPFYPWFYTRLYQQSYPWFYTR